MTTLYSAKDGRKATLIREYDHEHMQVAIDVRLEDGTVLKCEHDLQWFTSITQWHIAVDNVDGEPTEYVVMSNPFDVAMSRAGFLRFTKEYFGLASSDDFHVISSVELELDDELVSGLMSGRLQPITEVIK